MNAAPLALTTYQAEEWDSQISELEKCPQAAEERRRVLAFL
jgi:hypothetical protein